MGSASGINKEEFEPLGQKIHANDPAGDAETTYQAHVGGAGDAEWQCQAPEAFYGGFQGMPDHCQMAVLMDFNRGLDELYGSGRREANVKEMVDSPLPQQINSSSDRMMTYALTSSSKKDSKNKQQGDDDEDVVLGLPTGEVGGASVTVRDDTIPGFIDASYSGNALSPAQQIWQPLAQTINSPLQYDCLTLDDLINSEEFKYSAKAAWDRSFEGGSKREEGVSYFYNSSLQGFGWVDRARDSRSVFMYTNIEKANEVAKENGATWVVDLHTHPWKDGQRIPGVGLAQTPAIPSGDDGNGNGDIAVAKTTGKIGIILYPDFSERGFGITTYRELGVIEENLRKNYILGCSYKKRK